MTWFDGTAKEYFDITKSSKESGAKHKAFSTVVFVNGEKAVAEIQVMMLSPRKVVNDCEVDMVSYARVFMRLKKLDGQWKIVYGDCIYERDELLPVAPDGKMPALPEAVKDYRESYRYLSYVLSIQGFESQQDLPGDDCPETVEGLYAETNQWMFA